MDRNLLIIEKKTSPNLSKWRGTAHSPRFSKILFIIGVAEYTRLYSIADVVVMKFGFVILYRPSLIGEGYEDEVKMLNNEPNDEECDATTDAMKN